MDSKPAHNMQEDSYLSFNHRPQRVVMYNLLIFLWSTSNILFYCDIISDTPMVAPMFHSSTNNMLLAYHLMICTASVIILFASYYQFKIKDISTITFHLSLTQITFSEILNLFVGLLYFMSSLLHIAITWKMCGDVCGAMNQPSGCHITMLSSTLFAIALPFILCSDLIDNSLRNPHKRVLYFTLLIFIATFSYILEFQSNDFGDDTYYVSSYIRFSQISYWFITIATAIICICEGFYHEGILVRHFEIILSFILLCSPIVAYSTHLIEFKGLTASHPTWFLIVVFSIWTAYDLQRLRHFNINVIGAQSNMQERLILSSSDPLHTPTFMKDNINVIGAHSIQAQPQPERPQDDVFDYLVFKRFAFKLSDKKQRLLFFNVLLLIYSVGQFVYVFNFWVNYDKSSFARLKKMKPRVFAMHLTQGTYEWYCTSYVFMTMMAVSVIFMEWFVVSRVNATRYNIYHYSVSALYVFSGMIQCIAVSNGTNDYCTHLESVIGGDRNYCQLQYVGANFISIVLPLCVLSVDIVWSYGSIVIGCSKMLFGHTRVRVITFHVMIALSSLLFYVGYYNYYDELDVYTKVKLTGLLMIAFSFIFSTIMSPLFMYLDSSTFSNISTFIASLMIIIGIAFVLDVNDLDLNISEWVLFLPMCCLVAYEIQLLK
eukprot:23951_1